MAISIVVQNYVWRFEQPIVLSQLVSGEPQTKDLTIKKKLRPTIKGISLNDVLIIRNWLAYARMIGDESHTIITDQIYNSNFIEKKLKYRI